MKSLQALIVWGGWDGHKPEAVAQLFAADLRAQGATVRIESTLDVFTDLQALCAYDLIFPCWTMGHLNPEQTQNLSAAVRQGTGLGGIHGGMGDAFRGNLDYEWMVGGHFVGHPHVGPYTIRLSPTIHPITEGLPVEFPYHSEQYYLLVDPAITVLAESTYVYEAHRCTMPVVWIKHWGQGRVFYSALGHQPQEFLDHPHVRQMTVRGLLWASRSHP